MCVYCVCILLATGRMVAVFYHKLATITKCVFCYIYSEYKLVIISGNEDQDKSQLVSKLQLYCRPYTGSNQLQHYQDYLKRQFTTWPRRAGKKWLQEDVVASDVDIEK